MRWPAGFARDIRDGELIAWHDSPHVLYLMLDLKPGIRFMHINTARTSATRRMPACRPNWPRRGTPRDLPSATSNTPPSASSRNSVSRLPRPAHRGRHSPPRRGSMEKHGSSSPSIQPPAVFRTRGGTGRLHHPRAHPAAGGFATARPRSGDWNRKKTRKKIVIRTAGR